MNVLALIDRVRAVGGVLEPRGTVLRVSAPEPIPDDLMVLLRLHKPQLMATLVSQNVDAAPWGDTRAAIASLTVPDIRACWRCGGTTYQVRGGRRQCCGCPKSG